MYSPSNVHAFFANLTSPKNVDKKPSLEMLHSAKPANTGYIEESLQDVMMSSAAQNPPSMMATALNDFGVGLPPLASC